MTDDFEVNETGTVQKLCLTDMTLKAALAYIDATRDFQDGKIPLGEAMDAWTTLQALRAEYEANNG